MLRRSIVRKGFLSTALAAISIAALVAVGLPAFPAPPQVSAAVSFSDIASSPFKADILWLEDSGITSGCSPTKFCPLLAVSRGQMAAFLARAVALPTSATDYFTDDETSIFESDINRLAESGISGGCGNRKFCPDLPVTREQMAALLHRAIDAPLAPPDPGSSNGWVTILSDQFNSGGIPGHWNLYSGNLGKNCASRAHASVSGGALHLLMRWEPSGNCGAGWYTAGMQVDNAHGGVDQRVTVRFRVVPHGVTGHRIIPMRWPAEGGRGAGEQDFCEANPLTQCMTFLHYGSAQVYHTYNFDQRQWHTIRAEQRNHVVRVFIDDMSTPAWTFHGTNINVPNTVRRTVLQQECQKPCPSGRSGSEDIQIDWITIEKPA